MARGKNRSPPSYRLHKRTGRAVVTIDGRDIYIGDYGTEDSRRQYGLLVAGEAVPQAKRDPEPEHRPISLVEVLSAFWTHARTYYVKDEVAARISALIATETFGFEPRRAVRRNDDFNRLRAAPPT